MPLAVFAAVCLAAVELARFIDDPTVIGSFPAFFPLAGVVLALLITTAQRAWLPLVLIACGAMLLSALIHGGPLLPPLAAALIFGVQSIVTASVIRRSTAQQPFALDRLPHAFALVAAGVLVPLAGGFLAGVILMSRNPEAILPVWRTWWLSDTIGIFVTTPLVLAAMSARRDTFAILRSWKGLEIAFVLAAGLAVAEGVFGGWVGPYFQVPAYILPFLLWPVFRFGPETGSVAAFIVGYLALWHATRGEGPLALVAGEDVVLRSQGGLAIAAASVLLLSSIVADRKRVTQEHAALVTELQRALAEIRTLRGFIPICAWCHKVRDDSGFWQQIEKYLDERTDATFSHSICPACHELERLEIEAHEISEHVS
jgi:integral membrane sensor domain MASE1